MGRNELAELTTMCMVYDDNGNVLVQDRNDPNWPGIVFPGGHVEKGEPFLSAAIREVKEETGLDITDARLCGLKQFYTDEGVRYIVAFYKSKSFSGDIKSSDEGDVFWIKLDEIDNYKCARSMKEMLPVFINDDINECFFGQDGEVITI